jgi:hypothetical protein
MDFQNLAYKPRCLIIEQKKQKNVCYCQHTEKKLTAELQKCVKVLAKKLHSKKTQNLLNIFSELKRQKRYFLMMKWWLGF